MRIDRLRAQITVSGDAKAVAVLIAILSSVVNIERVLHTVATWFGFRLERK